MRFTQSEIEAATAKAISSRNPMDDPNQKQARLTSEIRRLRSLNFTYSDICRLTGANPYRVISDTLSEEEADRLTRNPNNEFKAALVQWESTKRGFNTSTYTTEQGWVKS